MKDFDWTSFTKKIAIRTTPDEVYKAWTHAEALEKWFLMEAVFLDPQGNHFKSNEAVTVDSTYKWKWHLYDEVAAGTVLAANGKDFFQFIFERNSIVDINLTEANGYVIVELRQHNIPVDDDSKKYVRLGCASGWAFYLVNLKSVLEGGLDLRNKDTNLSPMINN